MGLASRNCKWFQERETAAKRQRETQQKRKAITRFLGPVAIAAAMGYAAATVGPMIATEIAAATPLIASSLGTSSPTIASSLGSTAAIPTLLLHDYITSYLDSKITKYKTESTKAKGKADKWKSIKEKAGMLLDESEVEQEKFDKLKRQADKLPKPTGNL